MEIIFILNFVSSDSSIGCTGKNSNRCEVYLTNATCIKHYSEDVPICQENIIQAGNIQTTLAASMPIVRESTAYKFEKITPSIESDFARLRKQEIIEEFNAKNSNIADFCDLNKKNNCTNLLNFSLYDEQQIKFRFNNETCTIKINVLNNNTTKIFYDSDITNFLSYNANISEEYFLSPQLRLKVLSINNYSYTYNKYIDTVELVIWVAPEYLCSGFWNDESCYLENSTFMLENKTYLIETGGFLKEIINKSEAIPSENNPENFSETIPFKTEKKQSLFQLFFKRMFNRNYI